MSDTSATSEPPSSSEADAGSDSPRLPTWLVERLVAGSRPVVLIGDALRDAAESASVRSAIDAVKGSSQWRHAASVRAAVDSRAASTAEAAGLGEAAVMSLADEAIRDARTGPLLGEACRHFSARLLVELRHESGDPETGMQAATRLFAFGFRRLGDIDASDSRLTWYEYSLRNYKPAPDWLNARFWANPERFDQHDD